jgi:hypothetical protein
MVVPIVKICAYCEKEFIDNTRNHSKKSCCERCRDLLWLRENDLHTKLRLRFNNNTLHGGTLTEIEKEKIIKKLETGVCDLCHEEVPFRNLCIDHDHNTGLYRGVICKECNTFLAYLERKIDILQDALSFVGLSI